ncbi:hypothetical protein BGX33_005862 [Mortierella sp. NVP41]|nr:hypothetical protein BGX33_005862 [Mortierella sp. NVP41]
MNPSCSAPGRNARSTARFHSTPRQHRHTSWTTATATATATTTTTAMIKILLASLALLSTASAAITCALPAGGTYKAGDGVVLDWGSDGTSPVVSDIVSVNGSLFCNTGTKIAEFAIPNLTGSYNWTLPSVGNATTVGGTIGTCAQNAFHMEYSGMANGFLGIVKIPWGPVQCGTISILPAPNGTLTTTTTTTSPTSTSTTATSSPTASNIADSSNGGLSTVVIVVIAVVAAVIVTLSFVALVVCLRRRRRQRKLDSVLMPWNPNANNINRISHASTANINGFTKISSMDDGPGSGLPEDSGSGSGGGGAGGMSSVAGGGGRGVGLVGAVFALKSQQDRPLSSRNQYYPDEADYGNYGYQQQELLQSQQQQQQQQGYQQGYDGYNEDDAYYNPYYASGGLEGAAAAAAMNHSTTSFYSYGSGAPNGARLSGPYGQDPYQSAPDLYQQLQQQHQHQQQHQQQPHPQRGYYPLPPTNTSSSAVNLARARSPEATPGLGPQQQDSGPLGSALTSLPITTSSRSSSPRRGPQKIVMPEMGRKEAVAEDKEKKKDKDMDERKDEDTSIKVVVSSPTKAEA